MMKRIFWTCASVGCACLIPTLLSSPALAEDELPRSRTPIVRAIRDAHPVLTVEQVEPTSWVSFSLHTQTYPDIEWCAPVRRSIHLSTYVDPWSHAGDDFAHARRASRHATEDTFRAESLADHAERDVYRYGSYHPHTFRAWERAERADRHAARARMHAARDLNHALHSDWHPYVRVNDSWDWEYLD